MPTNTSVVTGFILVGFSRLTSLQGLLFSFFLTVYLLTVAGNLLIVVLVSADAALRTPMYFPSKPLNPGDRLHVCHGPPAASPPPHRSAPHPSLWLCSPDVLSPFWCHRVLPPGSHGL